jgi:arylformamidase
MTELYRDFDQAALDAAYNNRAHVPGHGADFARWQRDSATARAELEHRADLAYGQWPRQRLDYFPAATATAPLLVFIHGGYWQAFDQRSFDYLAPAFVRAGVAFAALTHALCPDIDMNGLVQQVHEGIAWLWGRAGELGFDRDRLLVAGHSAGGHLAALLAGADWRQRGLPADAVKGAVAVSGLYDLEPIRLSYLNGALQLDAPTARRLSPQHSLAPAGRPMAPLLLAVGAAELPEYDRQQRDYAAALQERGHAVATMTLDGCHHFTALDALGTPDHPLHRAVLRMISSGSVV